MIQGLAIAVLTAGLLLGAWTGVQALRRRPTTEAQMVGAIVLEAAALVQSGIAIVRLVRGEAVDEPVTFVAYAVGILLPLPLGFYLARVERTRWGSVVAVLHCGGGGRDDPAADAALEGRPWLTADARRPGGPAGARHGRDTGRGTGFGPGRPMRTPGCDPDRPDRAAPGTDRAVR